VAELRVKQRLGARKTDDRAELVRAIREAMGSKVACFGYKLSLYLQPG